MSSAQLCEPLELIIFDCDGVLVDSERVAVRVDVEVIGKLGWQLTEQKVIERFVGLSNESIGKIISEHLGITLTENWDSEYNTLYRQAFEKELKAVPGVESLLKSLCAPYCVASSGSHEKMRFTLGLTGLYHYFEGRIF